MTFAVTTMQSVISKTWTFVSAQTDFVLEALDATQRMAVTFACATVAHGTVPDVPVRLGFAAATLPPVVNDSGTGSVGVFFDHGAIAPGGGAVESNGGAPIAISGPDEDLRITCGAATSGSLKVTVTWQPMAA